MNTVLKSLFIAAICALSFFGGAQTVNDNAREIAQAASDSEKVDLLYASAIRRSAISPEETVEKMDEALRLSSNSNYKAGYKKISKAIIAYLFEHHMYSLAIRYCKAYTDFCEREKLSEEQYNYYNTLGTLYLNAGDYTNALRYYNLKRQYDLDHEDFKSYAFGMQNVGNLQYEKKQYDSSLIYTRWAAEMFRRSNMPTEMAYAVLSGARACLAKKDFDNAALKAGESFAVFTANNNKSGTCSSLFILGQVQSQSQQPDTAFKLFSTALSFADSLNSIALKRDCYKGMYELYCAQKNEKESGEYKILFSRYEDSLSHSLLHGKELDEVVMAKIDTREAEYQKNLQLKKWMLLAVFVLAGAAGIWHFGKKARKP